MQEAQYRSQALICHSVVGGRCPLMSRHHTFVRSVQVMACAPEVLAGATLICGGGDGAHALAAKTKIKAENTRITARKTNGFAQT